MKPNRVYNMAIEELKNYPYDMQDELPNETIAATCQQIVSRLNRFGGVTQQTIYANLGTYKVKVRNARRDSFISLSNEDTTAVSRSMAEITDISRPVTQEEVSEIISMLNEAWYTLFH